MFLLSIAIPWILFHGDSFLIVLNWIIPHSSRPLASSYWTASTFWHWLLPGHMNMFLLYFRHYVPVCILPDSYSPGTNADVFCCKITLCIHRCPSWPPLLYHIPSDRCTLSSLSQKALAACIVILTECSWLQAMIASYSPYYPNEVPGTRREYREGEFSSAFRTILLYKIVRRKNHLNQSDFSCMILVLA